MRVMADERGMIVGALDARFRLKRVGVRPEREKGVVERGGFSSGEAAALRLSGGRGLVERRPNSLSSEFPTAERLRLSCSGNASAVLAVLRFVSGLRPTTVP